MNGMGRWASQSRSRRLLGVVVEEEEGENRD
jgi:hypothetical protein